MDTQKINNWVQIVAAIAVLVGLVLVAYELEQSREIAEAQLLSDGFAAHAGRDHAMLGENPAQTLAKACSDPGDLTADDLVILHSYYYNQLSVALRSRAIAAQTAVFGSPEDLRYESRFGHIFETPYGRYWWGEARAVFLAVDPGLAAQGDSVLDSLDESISCSDHIDGYAEYLERLNTP